MKENDYTLHFLPALVSNKNGYTTCIVSIQELLVQYVTAVFIVMVKSKIMKSIDAIWHGLKADGFN
jgi:hypothetical protein